MIKKKDSQKGFAMLFTVLVISIILSISIGISNITFKQNILSSIAKDSQVAFFVADTGIECGLLHDLNTSQFARGVTSVPSTLSCGNMVFEYDDLASEQDRFVYKENVSNLNNPCRVIIFDKTNSSLNSVKSRGYNICKQTPRQVERALEAKFQNQNPESIIKEKLTEILALGEAYKASNSNSYSNICNVDGDSNVSSIQGAMDYIKSTGASVKCYVRSDTSSVDWGVGVLYSPERYTAGPVEGVMKIKQNNEGQMNWNAAFTACSNLGASLMGIGGFKSLRLIGPLNDGFMVNGSYWTNTPNGVNKIGIITNNGVDGLFAPTGNTLRVRCGFPL